MKHATRRKLIGLGLAAALAPAPLAAGGHHDHERARRAVEGGEALPLADILTRVRADLAGEVVGVSLERKRGRWVYEFKVIGASGRLTEIYIDAASAEVIKREEH